MLRMRTLAVLAIALCIHALAGLQCAGAVGKTCNNGGGGQDCAQDGSEVCQLGSCMCAAGYGYTGDDCVECGFQFYKSSAGNEACSETIRCDKGERWFKPSNTEDATCPPCPLGKYQDKTGHRDTQCYDPSTCEAGKYVTQEPNTKQDRECGLCEPGKYTGAPNQPTCNDCPGGKYQNAEGQSECKDPTVCMPGEYIMADPTATTNRICFHCVEGMYSDTTMAEQCKTCDSGKYQDRHAQTGCKNWRTCGRGKKWTAGSTTDDATCSNCGPGKYQDEIGHQDTSCKDCPTGEFQPGSGASSCEVWTTCGQGEKWISGSATEDASCLPCGSQEYQSKTAHQDMSCNAWTTCSSGYYVTADPTSSSDRTCDKCDAGTYGDTTNADNCKSCGPGKYQDVSGQTDCKDWKMCSQGEKWTSGSSTEDATCSPCSPRHYQSKSSHQDTSCTSWSTCGPGMR
ncbi:hypothetical protein PTSG_06003 [Salpingoeca rosetta]|uniref:TNFR-Cys domain-containing protein n=1 Tax=Salpingoeca rosetta (strain ATCC 50818 / BSB-021) TaxID=946362 RepID=F2UDE3_SALR5|nr:uncharacterized protein PTSG_06003 [Salpingoeca rosetta]EGD74638.1 hypothetical protein PTSG_06003 [Salpingoeca rosetta]|eukprot:XP_004992895.1 hypothetical protein PTSG_06003 [Salpingoeca rosetta]